MNRKYTPEEYAGYIANLRAHFQNPAITTDIIAGFPGETEACHRDTLKFLCEIGFAKIHVFPYSRREGTAAARMGGDIAGPEKRRRAAEIAELAKKMQQEYLSQFIGEQEVVLLEEEERGSKRMLGYTARYQRVLVEGGAENQLVQVRVFGLEGETLQAKLL